MAVVARARPTEPLVDLSGVDKAFVPGSPVLRGVDLSVESGEIHALLGENGAGKSTLMNVLIGLVRPDRGRLDVRGRTVDLSRYGPARAVELGIGMVHQHSTLVGSMTVEENFAFGDPRSRLFFDRKRLRTRLRELSERHQLEVSLGTRVVDLSVGQRQRAEILRALDRGAELLILDEPTATLTPAETAALFPALRQLREDGCSVIFISHKLDEVEALADRVTVLRRGQVTGEARAGALDARALGRLMLGRDLPGLDRPEARSPRDAAPILRLRSVSASGLREGSALRNIDLGVRAGEIMGVAGIDGNGQRELEEVLAGVRPIESGALEVDGETVQPNIRTLRGLGVSQISGDRQSAGLISQFSLAENWILKSSYHDPNFFPHGVLDVGAAVRETRAAIARYDIRPGDPKAKIATLSGGNAQKLAVARELAMQPRLLVAVNPTRGLDVGSARFVHEQLLAVREHGGGVLLISTELDEVLALADRVVVLARGEIHPVEAGADRAAIGAAMLGQGAR